MEKEIQIRVTEAQPFLELKRRVRQRGWQVTVNVMATECPVRHQNR